MRSTCVVSYQILPDTTGRYAAILQSPAKTLAAGLVVLILIIVAASLVSESFVKLDYHWWDFFARWLHVLSGVMWIGLLWEFNFVQAPMMPRIEPVEHRAAGPSSWRRPRCSGAAARLAGMTSRLNTMLSIPMLFCRVAQGNAGL
jgi:hypothetical protein